MSEYLATAIEAARAAGAYQMDRFRDHRSNGGRNDNQRRETDDHDGSVEDSHDDSPTDGHGGSAGDGHGDSSTDGHGGSAEDGHGGSAEDGHSGPRGDGQRPIEGESAIDRESESLIVERLREAYPDHRVLTEEAGRIDGGGARWIVDPLDGTANYLRGLPAFAVSIAFERDGQVEAGVVYHPPRDELYAATRDGWVPEEAVSLGVSAVTDTERAFVSVPYASDSLDRPALWDSQRRIARQVAGVRSTGAGALDLATVAAGRTDAACGFDQHEWDRAAGLLLVAAAGGRVTDHCGGRPVGGDFLASNGHVHDALLDALAVECD